MKKLLSLLLLTFLLFSSAFSQDKVMKMIQNGDYDKAFDALIKKYQKSPEDVATNYMLSRLYSSSGFKSYDAEIAYDHLCTAKKGYTACDQSDKDKLMDIPLNDNILNDATADINKKGFDALVKYKDPEKCNKYLEKHTDAGDLLRQAKQLRDKYALEQAEKKNTPEAYMEAMKKYPDASNFQLLKIRFDKLMFDKETSAGTLACYVDYLRNNPGTGFREIAEDKIFQLAVPNKTLDEYMLFVSKFPENKNTGEAYNAIYKSVNWDDGEYGTIQKFFMQYPDFPRDHKGLSSDIALAELAWELGLTERIAVSPFGNLSQKQATNDELNRRLQNAGAKTGEIQISLMWNGYNDIDLYCEEPSGESVWFRHRKSASGGELDVDMNAAYGGRFLDLEDQGGDKNEAYKALYDSVRQPVIQEGVKYYEKRTSSSPCENIYWPKGNIPSGKYKIYVSFFNDYKYDSKCGGHTVEDCPDTVEYSVRLRIGEEYRDFT
ncbi:MAG: hypothetical protein KKA07_10445, partial [Bacteroidetes bacterium]|nr:hypothetical protein [Bacteroidota bacterium]